MIARKASCCVWFRSPHIRPARWKATGGKFDQRCFCAVSLQSNDTVSFRASSSVARNAFAAWTVAWTGAPATAVAGAPADADGAVVVAVEPDVPDEHEARAS